MPKMKTHASAAKRFRVTAGGKIIRGQAGRSHLNGKKSPKRKRALDRVLVVHHTNLKKLGLQLPYLMKHAHK